MLALVDADQVAFACAASAEDSDVTIACARANDMVDGILQDVQADEFELWLSGGNNFRYSVYPEYKANRKDAYRPKWEKEVKDYLRGEWNANTTDGIEADDMLGIRQNEIIKDQGYTSVLAHLDKDLNQLEGNHFNWELKRLGTIVREKRKYFVTLEEGNRFFYYQLLTGDTTDNIKGVNGIGPKKATALLDSLAKHEWYEAIRDLYACEEELDLNAQCLYIHRKHGDTWRNLLSRQQLTGRLSDPRKDGQKDD